MRRAVTAGAVALGTLVAHPAAAECKLGKIAELRVTMTGLQPLVPAKVNGQEAQFLVDSGAFYSMITPAAALQYGLKTYSLPAGLDVRGVGGSARASAATIKTFTLADVPIKDLEFIVADMGGGAGAGLIGQNVLRLRDVEYDLANGVIRLFEPRGCDGVNFAYWAGSQAVAELKIEAGDRGSPFTIGTASVNGKPIRALFDTGAGISAMTLSAGAYAGIKPDSPGVTSMGVSRGIGRKVSRTWAVPVATFELGGETVTNTRMEMGDFNIGRSDMLVGADFFLSHRVYVANSQHRMFFTYNGGTIFRLAGAPVVHRPTPEIAAAAGPPDAASTSPAVGTLPASPSDPTDADGYARRGAAYLARREYGSALSDFTKAVELAPGEPRYLYQRALARTGLRQPFLAMADLDAALKIKPDDVQALFARAELRRAGRDVAGERADLDAVAAHAPKEADLRLQLAGLYLNLDAVEPSTGEYDLWIASHPDDSRMPQARAGRCRARTLAGRDLPTAMEDCNSALRDRARYGAALETRGLLRLRMGDLDRALEDFDAALTLQPKAPWSLYGRGVARLKKGRKVEGEADLAAAANLAPRVAERAARFGLSSQTAPAAPSPGTMTNP